MGRGDIENETLLGVITPVNQFLEGIQEHARRVPLIFAPESDNTPISPSSSNVWEALTYSQKAHAYQQMRAGQDFVFAATDMLKLPENYYEAIPLVAPLGIKTLNIAAKSLKTIPIFNIKNSVARNTATSTVKTTTTAEMSSAATSSRKPVTTATNQNRGNIDLPDLPGGYHYKQGFQKSRRRFCF